MELVFNSKQLAFLIAILIIIVNGSASALPLLDEPSEIPADAIEHVTVFPDSENDKSLHRYWLVPSRAKILRHDDGTLAYGLVHSGVSGFDPDGINVLLNVVVQPDINRDALKAVQAFIKRRASGQGVKDVEFAFIRATETTCRLLVGGQFIDWDGNVKTVVNGGSIEAGIPLQVKVVNNFDVRALTQAGGPEAATFGALFTMKFQGKGNQIHFEVVADFDQSLLYFSVEAKSHAYYNAFQQHSKDEWKRLKDKGIVKVIIHEGTEKEVERYMDRFVAQRMIDSLLSQLALRTGRFARSVNPGDKPSPPEGTSYVGWGVAIGGGFTAIDDKSSLRFEANLSLTREHEITYGMNFVSAAEQLSSYTKNLTDTTKPFPTSDDFKTRTEQEGECKKRNLEALKDYVDRGLIPQDLWAELAREALAKGCYVNFGTAKSDSAKNTSDNVPLPLELEFQRMKRSEHKDRE